jgi:transposase
MINTTTQHYEQMLGLTAPWTVSDINLDTENLRLSIRISVPRGAKLPCPICGRPCNKADHREERTWRHLDAMQFETIISCNVPRINCPEHGIKTVNVPWADNYSRFTFLFERFAIDVLESAKNITSAKRLLKLSWRQIHRIQKRAVERGMARRDKEKIIHVGIDEKNFLKGHSYASILNDLGKGRVLDVVEGRTEESAKALLNTGLSDEQKKQVEAIAMDMWDAFMSASKEMLPQADIVHDKYHVSGYLSKAVDSVRKKENGHLLKTGDDTLKGSKYLWLYNPDNFSKDAKKKFREFALDELQVGRAWAIKESFRHFWFYKYKGAAGRFFNQWYFWATHSKLKPIIDSVKTLKRHYDGIIAYLKHHITNAVSEGINSKIQSIKANARGFRNFQNYRIAILFHCGKLNLYP